MKKTKTPKKVELTTLQAKVLEKRLRENSLTDSDVETFLGLLSFNLWMQDQLSRAKLTIKRLRKMFGFHNESRKNTCDNKHGSENDDNGYNSDDESDANTSDDTLPDNNPMTKPNLKNWDPSKNHGRNGADDYLGCPLVPVTFQEQQFVDDKCPDCAEHNTDASLYQVEPSYLVLLDSQPLVFGNRYERERVRCTLCQKYFTAPLPDEVAQQSKYSYRCHTAIAIYHYYMGVPFNRLETLQASQGIPLPDSTQYDLMNQLYQAVIKPVAEALRLLAANGNALYFDDTAGRILEQTILNQQAGTGKSKKSVHATALLSDYQGHRIYLFDTNTQTAGQQLKSLFSQRNTEDKFITMSDASATNFPMLDDSLMARWVISLCLAHGRRRFVELVGDQDEDMIFILELIAKIYINDRHCKDKKYNPERRLEYHQQHSGPVIAAMYTWFNNLILYKQVEPNGRFGEAILYMLKRWEWLTQFLQIPGASLDNNICEQAIKVMIRYRKNSLFYRTFYSASVGDAMMSVLHTAINAGVNVFDYLNTLQAHAAFVQENPECWLPWNYHETLVSREKIVPDQIDTS